MRILFFIQLIVAFLMGVMSALVEMRPHVLLDVVLTPEQLRDEATRDDALALMQRATTSGARIYARFVARNALESPTLT